MSENKSGPPAKARYDAKFPVISFRVSKEQAEKIATLMEVSRKSSGEIMRTALQLEFDKSNAVYERGRRDGFSEAKKKYRIQVRCQECEEYTTLVKETTKNEIGCAAMSVLEVYHDDCRPQEVPKEDCLLIGMKQKGASKVKMKGSRRKKSEGESASRT